MTEDSKTAGADSEVFTVPPDPDEVAPASQDWAKEADNLDGDGQVPADGAAKRNDDNMGAGDATAENAGDGADAADSRDEVESDSVDAEQEVTEVDPESDPATLRRQRDEFQNLLLRKAAELDNVRKRVDRERLELQQSAAADLLSELLPIVDDLERALAVTPESTSVTSYRDGVELIRKQIMEVLEKRGVAPIEALGADFDPNYHQAVAVDTTDGHTDGEVTAELRRGYTVGGRLLRAAMVRVAKA